MFVCIVILILYILLPTLLLFASLGMTHFTKSFPPFCEAQKLFNAQQRLSCLWLGRCSRNIGMTGAPEITVQVLKAKEIGNDNKTRFLGLSELLESM